MADDSWWDTFFRGPYELVQLNIGYPEEQSQNEVDFVTKVLDIRPGQAVLDIPCGCGRHSLELAKRGYAAMGIDLNRKAIEQGKQQAEAENIKVDLREGDVLSFELDPVFDAAFCFFGSFGYFTDEDNKLFAQNVARTLKPGGRFLIDLHVAESLFARFRNRYWSSIGDARAKVTILEEAHWDISTGRVQTDWTFITDKQVQTAHSSIRLYTYRELCELLQAAGFASFTGLESGTEKTFTLGANRLSLVATK